VVHPRAGHPNTGSTRNRFNAICAEFSRPLATSSSPGSVSAVRLSVDPKLAGLRDLARNQAMGDLPEDQAGLDVRYGLRPTMEPTTGYGDGTGTRFSPGPVPAETPRPLRQSRRARTPASSSDCHGLPRPPGALEPEVEG
jgi:hypothetical protein